MDQVINLNNRREYFWDDYFVDAKRTTAQLLLHHPVRREIVIKHDQIWEGDGCDLYTIVPDDGFYRLYYLAWSMEIVKKEPEGKIDYFAVCYAESQDGINWVKPKLGICEFQGSKDNNIILITGHPGEFYNFSVFKDTNPQCAEKERYKGIYLHKDRIGKEIKYSLRCAVSEDGIHFHVGWDLMVGKASFDSSNFAFWDNQRQKYWCYVRGEHRRDDQDLSAEDIRDIRVMESMDFRSWTDPVPVDFNGSDDYQLYTNVISPYYRSPEMFIGFPSRYVRRKSWTSNFNRLCGAEARRARMQAAPRFGLTTTDCVFMCSRDGWHWRRYDEAFMRPGSEHPLRWVYGDCYPAQGLIETGSAIAGEDPELSIYDFSNHWSGQTVDLWRHTLRIDGFVSYHANYHPCELHTKLFTFKGNELHINFSTSAMGSIEISFLDEYSTVMPGYASGELFGDSIDRIVDFASDLALIQDQPVSLKIIMSDADIYSLQFVEAGHSND
jgi:hypothetical protein